MRLKRPRRLLLSALLLAGLAAAASGCQLNRNQRQAEAERFSRLELRLQQLEQRLNQIPTGKAADPGGKQPPGPVKSLTYRTSDQGNRLRIYWADGSSSDLECTQEQSTLACG